MTTDVHEKRIAIVTGAGKGIGRTIAMTLARKGMVPVVVDIDGHAAQQVAREIGTEGIETADFTCDVADVADLNRCFADIYRQFGAIDILVNNAGVLSTLDVTEITEEEWQRVMDINVKSAVFASQAALTYMLPQKRGRIINISSMAGQMGGYSTGCVYSVSKAALIGLTMQVARRVAGEGITVNAIAPGPTNTEMVQGFTAEQRRALTEHIPVGRLIEPEGIAETVSFLASDAAGFITGAVINVNGGMFMG